MFCSLKCLSCLGLPHSFVYILFVLLRAAISKVAMLSTFLPANEQQPEDEREKVLLLE